MVSKSGYSAIPLNTLQFPNSSPGLLNRLLKTMRSSNASFTLIARDKKGRLLKGPSKLLHCFYSWMISPLI